MNLRSLIKEAVSESMHIDKFGDEREMVTNYAGWTAPKATFTSRVKDLLVDIIMEEEGISEKNFTGVDQAIREVRRFFEHSEPARSVLSDLAAQEVRPRYAAEAIYRQWGELNKLHDDDGIANIHEGEDYKKLRDDQVKLTDEERTEVIVKGAVWRDGTPGVWKSLDKKGNVQYCSNTHRAMAVSKTLAAAIKKFPEIEATA